MYIRISQIPPITGALEDLDLLEVSEYIGGGVYRSHSVPISALKYDLFDWIQEDHQLDFSDLSFEGIHLAFEPRDVDSVTLDILNGPPQIRGIDFDIHSVSADVLTWSGYALSGDLSIGDIISIKYVK